LPKILQKGEQLSTN
jgi:hypothetical protein